MKVLCLHGYGQHEKSIKDTFSNIDNLLTKKYNAKLYYPNGIYNVLNFKKENGYAWFLAENEELFTFFNTDTYIGIDKSINFIKEYIDVNGPFDGIIGFSQGSVITSIILGLNMHPFKFAIIIGSYYITDENYKNYDQIKIPTLHIWGNNDSIVESFRSEKVYENYINEKEKLIHEGKHVIPSNSISRKTYENFINKYWLNAK